MAKGVFISLEGPDGSGKSTQRRLLAQALRRRGIKVLETREPGGSAQASKIRALVLKSKGKLADPAELLLFLADRAQHVADTLRPALAKGLVVLCDRYSDSTLAYQGGGRGMNWAALETLNRFATGGLKPRVTLLFDLDSAAGLGRAAGRRASADRMELAGAAFHRRVRAAFLKLAKREPGRIKLIKVSGRGPEEIRDEALKHILKVVH